MLYRNHYPWRVILKHDPKNSIIFTGDDIGAQTEYHARGIVVELIRRGVGVVGVKLEKIE